MLSLLFTLSGGSSYIFFKTFFLATVYDTKQKTFNFNKILTDRDIWLYVYRWLPYENDGEA